MTVHAKISEGTIAIFSRRITEQNDFGVNNTVFVQTKQFFFVYKNCAIKTNASLETKEYVTSLPTLYRVRRESSELVNYWFTRLACKKSKKRTIIRPMFSSCVLGLKAELKCHCKPRAGRLLSQN